MPRRRVTLLEMLVILLLVGILAVMLVLRFIRMVLGLGRRAPVSDVPPDGTDIP